MAAGSIRVALIGAGTVGSAVIGLLTDSSRRAMVADAAGTTIDLVGVAVRHPSLARAGVDPRLVTDSAVALAARDDIDILVEVAGGVADVATAIEVALDHSVAVVTANKALMAARGTELITRACAHETDLFYEAAVGGGIPILRALRSSLAGERILRVLGIVNGTTNYVLSQMDADSCSLDSALADAQALGYAEADPHADVSGADAADKVAILASLAFGTPLAGEVVDHDGIAAITSADVAFARSHGLIIKLVGVAERVGDHGVSRRVHPAMLDRAHPLAAVSGAMNAVFVEGTHSGPLMWLGAGAGGAPTAGAVLGDIISAARNRRAGRFDAPLSIDPTLTPVTRGDLESVYYLALDVVDQPGVLAAVAGVFGRHGVSIRTMEQTGVGDEARLCFLTHAVRTSDLLRTTHELGHLDVVDRVGPCVPVLAGGV